MGAEDKAKAKKSYTTGNIEKASIEILEVNPTDTNLESPVPIKSGGAAPRGKLSSSNIMVASEAAINETAIDVLQSSGMTEATADLGSDKVKNKIFYVQFNPSELDLSGYGGGRMAKNNYAEKKDGVRTNELTFDSMDVRIELRVKLIFDQVDPQDAFMADKLTASWTSIIEGVTKAGLIGAGKKEPCSVQKQVEAFIGALRSPNTRQVVFSWGNMCYTGVLNKVIAHYTMFNVVGAPVRATVDLSIVCADEKDENSMGAWYTAYKNAFEGGSKSYVKNGQKMGNLLNVNL